MEIELKYRIPDMQTAVRIWNDELFSEFEEADSRMEIPLAAKYYDTEDCDLMNNRISYRIRREGERLIATLKWKGVNEDALHVREELTMPVQSDVPDLRLFQDSEIGVEVAKLVEGKELRSILQTTVLRKMFRIDTGEGIFEVSVDSGTISTACGSEEVLEVEVELYSGETEELLSVGRKLEEAYDLTPETVSKYARGIRQLEAGGVLKEE